MYAVVWCPMSIRYSCLRLSLPSSCYCLMHRPSWRQGLCSAFTSIYLVDIVSQFNFKHFTERVVHILLLPLSSVIQFWNAEITAVALKKKTLKFPFKFVSFTWTECEILAYWVKDKQKCVRMQGKFIVTVTGCKKNQSACFVNKKWVNKWGRLFRPCVCPHFMIFYSLSLYYKCVVIE